MKRVERPLMGVRAHWDINKEVAAIMLTVKDGMAVQFSYSSPSEARKIRYALRHALLKRGFILRSKQVKSELICWAEKVK